MRLDFPHRHPACAQRQYLVVKARPAGRVSGNTLRLKAGEPVARNLNRQFAELASKGHHALLVHAPDAKDSDQVMELLKDSKLTFGQKYRQLVIEDLV